MISIWGFMGSGKSAIGHWIAKHHHWTHIDSDQQIEEQEYMSIANIFKRHGEDYFRKKETMFLEQLVQDKQEGIVPDNIILTTGGGMPVREKNRQLLKQLGVSVFLNVTFERIVKRLSTDRKRPLWNQADLTKMKQRYDMRFPIYQQADHIISTDGLKVKEIAQSIMLKK